MRDPKGILREYWGHGEFRPMQEDIIRAILSGHDTLALLPTGGGKSVCFQVPGMVFPASPWSFRRSSPSCATKSKT
jgi:ATP-dependent DNA helicase RecQ